MRLVVVCFVLFQVMVIAQPKPSLNNFAWLEGRWSGAKEGRLNEEWFSAAEGGSISVMFRMTSQDKTMILQLGTITEDQDGIVLRTRSFGPRLQPYGEDPLELRLLALTGQTAEFINSKNTKPKRTLFIRDAPDILRVRSEIVQDDGKEEVHELSMNRMR
jgi:hypothetical protein